MLPKINYLTELKPAAIRMLLLLKGS